MSHPSQPADCFDFDARLEQVKDERARAAYDLVVQRAKSEATMSQNVAKCRTSERNCLPKPPRLSDAPTADEIVAATADLALTPAQRLALAALVCGESIVVAAKRANVSPRTVHRWRHLPAFEETLQRLSSDAMESATSRMRSLLLRSTHVISDALLSQDQYRWAMRVIGSRQVWNVGARMPATPPDDADATPPASDRPGGGPETAGGLE